MSFAELDMSENLPEGLVTRIIDEEHNARPTVDQLLRELADATLFETDEEINAASIHLLRLSCGNGALPDILALS